MNLTIRRASLADDRQEILDLLNRNFGAGQDLRFDWRHKNHPAGEAWVWLAYDKNKAIATAAVFPRKMLVDGKPFLCGQVGGFAIDAGYRSLGPAVMLQRKTFEPVDAGFLSFCYDCPPHDQGMSTFVRLGMAPNCEITRYALPLRSEEIFRRRFGTGVWTTPLIAIANFLLTLRMPKRDMPGLEISEFFAEFGEEFSQLDRHVSTSHSVRASRSSELLNWCFRKNPVSEFRTLVARRLGELVGHVSFLEVQGRVSIIDVFTNHLATVGRALVDAVVDICRREKRLLVEADSSNTSELGSVLKNLRFSRRERTARVVAYEKHGASVPQLLDPSFRWILSHYELLV
jgi:hypothetical protein